MNQSAANRLIKTATENNIFLTSENENNDWIVVYSKDLKFRSAVATTHFLNALIAELHYVQEESEADNDAFPPGKEAVKQVVTAYDIHKILKIENKEELLSFPQFLVFTSSGNVCKVQNQNYLSIARIIEKSELDPNERPIYITGIKNYKGYLIVAFENGKVGKIDMSSYQTDFNRKKLKGAFNTESGLVFIEHILQDTDYAVMSDIQKVLVFNSHLINVVGSRTSKGVQVMKSKDGSKLVRMKKLEQTKFEDAEYYRNVNLNAVGYYLKTDDEF